MNLMKEKKKLIKVVINLVFFPFLFFFVNIISKYYLFI